MISNEKINKAIKICQLAEDEAKMHGEPVEVCYSGGKDSDVILELVKMSGIKYRAIYKNTTIDPPGTIKHVRDNNVEIIQPKKNFFTLIKEKGFPSFKFRFCCEKLKEYKILNVQILGIRAAESEKRKKLYKSFETCRIYNKKERVRQFFPTVDWTLEDVKDFIKKRGLTLAPYYYDEKGDINFKKRLGCMGCPLKTNKTEDFFLNKNLLRAWIRAGSVWCKNHGYLTVYELFLFRLFFRNIPDMQDYLYNNLQGEKRDAKSELERYFNIKLN